MDLDLRKVHFFPAVLASLTTAAAAAGREASP